MPRPCPRTAWGESHILAPDPLEGHPQQHGRIALWLLVQPSPWATILYTLWETEEGQKQNALG